MKRSLDNGVNGAILHVDKNQLLLLQKIVQRISDHPTELKYRSISCTSKTLKTTLGLNCEMYLSQLGFVRKQGDNNGNDVWYYCPEENDIGCIHTIHHCLKL